MIQAMALGLLRKLAAPLLAVAVGLLLGLLTYQWVKTSNTIDVLQERAANAEQRRQEAVETLVTARRKGAEEFETERQRNLAQEEAWKDSYKRAEEVRKNEIAVIQKSLADAAIQRDRVYDATRATYRAVTSAKPSGPDLVCRSDDAAAALGELLIRSDRVSESLGRKAEGLATQVRALQAEVQALEGAPKVLLNP